MRAPLTLFLISAVLWLLAGTALALISSFKLHDPQFLGDCEWLTFGRTRAAHLNTVIYGWSANAALAVALWLMARLSRSVLRHGALLLLLAAGALWNTGVTIGITGILKGDTTSVAWLEMPPYATPLLLLASVLTAAWAIITLRPGKSKHISISQYYILAALFWLPWLCTVAQTMIILAPPRGTVQTLVNWWFADNLTGLWFTPVALGAIYYLLPKVLGKPIHSRHLALLGFWTLAIFQGWTGARHLTGGPIPAWTITAGIAASLMMLIPIAATAINCHLTMAGGFSALKYSPTLRFIVFGAVNYTLAGLIAPLTATRTASQTLHFTHHTIAHTHHTMYAFFAMVMFGALYYILPRILLREWPNATLIRVHFWTCATGALLTIAGLTTAGLIQGLMMNATNPDGLVTYKFMEVIQALIPWLFSRSVAGILITIGHLAFAVNLFWMLAKKRAPQNTAPTLFRTPEKMEPAIK
jgi:cytochrome c oxidase cbb3-type subunit 1